MGKQTPRQCPVSLLTWQYHRGERLTLRNRLLRLARLHFDIRKSSCGYEPTAIVDNLLQPEAWFVWTFFLFFNSGFLDDFRRPPSVDASPNNFPVAVVLVSVCFVSVVLHGKPFEQTPLLASVLLLISPIDPKDPGGIVVQNGNLSPVML